MAYKFVVLPDAKKQLDKLDRHTAKRLVKKLIWLANLDNPLALAKPLTNAKIGDFRFRFGDYRAIAVVNEAKKTIAIAAIGHRREIYR